MSVRSRRRLGTSNRRAFPYGAGRGQPDRPYARYSFLAAGPGSRSITSCSVLLSMRQGPTHDSKNGARNSHPYLLLRRLPPARCKERIVPERCRDGRVDRVLDCRCPPAFAPAVMFPQVRPSIWAGYALDAHVWLGAGAANGQTAEHS